MTAPPVRTLPLDMLPPLCPRPQLTPEPGPVVPVSGTPSAPVGIKVTAPIDEALWSLAKSDLTIDQLFNQLASRRISLIISDQ